MEGALLIGDASNPRVARREVGALINEHIDGLLEIQARPK
jgi:hypothetical protein